MKLGVNVDHVATLRQARGTTYPDPVVAALLAEYAGCNSIVVHLREDRRHIQERDVALIKHTAKVPLNLEMSINKDIVAFAVAVKPFQATLVPERRQELTTEGGLRLEQQYKRVEVAVRKLQKAAVKVSLFIDPAKKAVKAARNLGVDLIEINTGRYSEAKTASASKRELKKIEAAADFAAEKGFLVAAGHGLDYENTRPILKIKPIEELNIGHSIVCRAVSVGLVAAVEEMVSLLESRTKGKNRSVNR